MNGLNKAADRACFVSDGSDDATDGGQTGIFAHGSVPSYSAAAGRTSASALVLADFAATIGTVAASALQRACRWWANPVFLPTLMLLKDGQEKILIPPTTPGGEWMLAGFPVTWTAAAPAVDSAGHSIAAFGRGEAFMFAIARDVQLRQSETPHVVSYSSEKRFAFRRTGSRRWGN